MTGDEHEVEHDADEQSEGALPEVDAEAVAEDVEATEAEVDAEQPDDEQLEREEHGEQQVDRAQPGCVVDEGGGAEAGQRGAV